MSKVLATLGIIGIIAVCFLGYIVSTYNYGNRAEKKIEASYTNLDNVLGQYSLKIQEMAQVPSIYKDDLKEVFQAAIEGRYGENGSQAMFQFLKEHNPNFDSKLYTNLQQTMDAGRTEFRNEQTVFIDIKREYETSLGSFPRGFVLTFFGYPKINLADYKTITSQHSTDTFKSGIDSGIKLR